MNRLFFTVFFVFSFLINGFLIARVNPFAPTQSSEDIPISNNYTQAPGNFKTVSFKLPKTSRIINYVEISYKNIDGSTEKLKVDIDKNKILLKVLSTDNMGAEKEVTFIIDEKGNIKSVKKGIEFKQLPMKYRT